MGDQDTTQWRASERVATDGTADGIVDAKHQPADVGRRARAKVHVHRALRSRIIQPGNTPATVDVAIDAPPFERKHVLHGSTSQVLNAGESNRSPNASTVVGSDVPDVGLSGASQRVFVSRAKKVDRRD